MRRSVIVAFAVVATLLTVAAMPAQAANASAVASRHTTFGTGGGEPSPTQLTNMSVEESGESARVVLGNRQLIDGFEDGDTDGWNADDEADFTATDSTARDGDWSAELTADGVYRWAERTLDESESADASVSIRIGAGSLSSGDFAARTTIDNADANQIARIIHEPSGDLVFNGETVGSWDDETWYDYRFAMDYDANEVTLIRNGDAVATDPMTADSEAWTRIRVGTNTFNSGGTVETYIDSVVSGSLPDNGTYVGPTHDAENVAEGFANLTLENVSADVTWQADPDDDGTFENVTSETYSSTGNYTVELSGTSDDEWRVRVDFEKTGDYPVAEIHDEGLLFEAASPTLSDPDPTGQIASYDDDISVNVSDRDLGLAQGDNVTVTATNENGGQIGQQSVTSNGTVTFTYDAIAGDNQIDWEAEDEYGNTDSTTQTFTTPGVIEVRNESDPGQLVDTNAEITATFFGGDGETVVERESANGTFDLSGLPADTEYVVQVDADGYRSRQVIITSLFEQQNIYLLPDNAQAAEVEYILDDKTGQFPQESSRLFIDIPLRVNNNTTFKTAFADEFGASGSLRVVLRDNTRYRIRVRNQQGDERVLGSYTTSGTDTVSLEIGQLRFAVADSPDTYNISAATIENDNGTIEAVKFNYRDPQDLTTKINVSVQTLNGTVIGQDTASGAFGSYSFRQDVNNSTAQNNTFVVVYELTRDGETVSGRLRPGLNRYPPGIPLGDGLKQLFSVGLLIMVGGLFSATNARVGAVVTPLFAAGLWYVEWLPPGTSILAIALALGVGVLVNYGERR